MKVRATFLSVLLLGASFVLSFEKVKSLSLAAEGISKVEIDCGAGFLKVTGDETLKSIEVRAEIIVTGKSEGKAQEYINKNVELYLEPKGSRAVLVSKFKEKFSLFNFGRREINLTVAVPKSIDLDIDDGSGQITVEDIRGKVKVDDGSGGLYLKNIEGDAVIDDGSGEIDASGITGNVDVDDGSGSIHLVNVGQNVILNDGSGSIDIDGVGGDVIIRDDGSGSVSIHNVKGKIIK